MHYEDAAEFAEYKTGGAAGSGGRSGGESRGAGERAGGAGGTGGRGEGDRGVVKQERNEDDGETKAGGGGTWGRSTEEQATCDALDTLFLKQRSVGGGKVLKAALKESLALSPTVIALLGEGGGAGGGGGDGGGGGGGGTDGKGGGGWFERGHAAFVGDTRPQLSQEEFRFFFGGGSDQAS
jgi:hypothetical protein